MMANLDDLDKIHNMLPESDNCSNQYKCVKHFYHLQCIANKFNKNFIHAYGVAGHGKGGVDHVDRLAKVIICQ